MVRPTIEFALRRALRSVLVLSLSCFPLYRVKKGLYGFSYTSTAPAFSIILADSPRRVETRVLSFHITVLGNKKWVKGYPG